MLDNMKSIILLGKLKENLISSILFFPEIKTNQFCFMLFKSNIASNSGNYYKFRISNFISCLTPKAVILSNVLNMYILNNDVAKTGARRVRAPPLVFAPSGSLQGGHRPPF